MKNRKKIAAWSSYWSEGSITSLPNLFIENYDGDVLRFWSEKFSELGEHSRVLDICTGNGAIAMIARDNFDRRGIHCDIHAIDVATIQPHELQRHGTNINKIEFHSGVAAEATPFSDDHFDLIVGQFALEYCDVEEGIKELSRIVREDGSVVLMMHHAESLTVRKTHELISIADIFLDEPTIIFRLRKYAEQYSQQKSMDAPKVVQKRQQLIASFDNAKKLLRQYPTSRFLEVTLNNIGQLAERVHDEPSVQVEVIREFEKTVKHHLIRAKDQRDAALDAEKISEIEALFTSYGFRSVLYQPYYLDEVLFSWTLEARRMDGE
jgi:ubiquinone/menaquinone biosynthesis C-methylase UbiE